MKAITSKLKSESGASISFALLLFLVCAVVSSIVIVAGTTASGRLSQMAEMDQRYYAVTSAARLLNDLIDGKSVTVEIQDDVTYDKNRTVTKTVHTKSIVVDEDTVKIIEKSTEMKDGTKTDDSAPLTLTVLERAASELAESVSAAGGSATPVVMNLALNGGLDDDTLAALQMQVTKMQYADGTLEFVVTNGGDNPYTLGLTFTMTKDTKIVQQTNVIHEDGGKTETTKTRITMTWKQSGIETINMLR